ncbi:hypothetical protein V7075_14110 [Neobacillus drentensis]|uniref:hypothetical protein n=1 Tax=Neobacillus drentensis TaxID=220684 RepID=UPI002FFD60DB
MVKNSTVLERLPEIQQEISQALLENQKQVQNWTVKLVEEQLTQLQSLKDMGKELQSKNVNQFNENLSKFRDFSNQQFSLEVLESFTNSFNPLKSLINLENNPYQSYFETTQNFLKQQQKTVQELYSKRTSFLVDQWISYFQKPQ